MGRGQKASAEQVELKRRPIEVRTAQGKSLAVARKEAELAEQSYDRWRKEYGGLQVDQAKKRKAPERENAGSSASTRGTQRSVPTVPADEEGPTRPILARASEYGRSGYRRVTPLLQEDGWRVGKDRVRRIWRREGLKVASRHRPRSRLWLNDGACVRLRPLRRRHVWSFDFVQAQTHDGRSLHILIRIDEHSRACLGLKAARRINRIGVIEATASQDTSAATMVPR